MDVWKQSNINFLHKLITHFYYIYISFKDNQPLNLKRIIKYWQFVINLRQSQFDEDAKTWLDNKTAIIDFPLHKIWTKSLAQQVPHTFLLSLLFSHQRHKDITKMMKSWKVSGSWVGSKSKFIRKLNSSSTQILFRRSCLSF